MEEQNQTVEQALKMYKDEIDKRVKWIEQYGRDAAIAYILQTVKRDTADFIWWMMALKHN